MLDPYVYPGTNILRNILGIQDRQTLDDAEADYVSLRLRELAENPLEGSYDVDHLAEMHKYIFQDIYEWAGKIRTINIEKEEPALGGLSIEYSDKAKIEGDLSDALKKMASRSWTNLSLDDRVNPSWNRNSNFLSAYTVTDSIIEFHKSSSNSSRISRHSCSSSRQRWICSFLPDCPRISFCIAPISSSAFLHSVSSSEKRRLYSSWSWICKRLIIFVSNVTC